MGWYKFGEVKEVQAYNGKVQALNGKVQAYNGKV